MGAPNNHLKIMLNFTKNCECTLLIYNMAQLVRVAKTTLLLSSRAAAASGFGPGDPGAFLEETACLQDCCVAWALHAGYPCGSRKPALQTEAVLCKYMD